MRARARVEGYVLRLGPSSAEAASSLHVGLDGTLSGVGTRARAGAGPAEQPRGAARGMWSGRGAGRGSSWRGSYAPAGGGGRGARAAARRARVARPGGGRRVTEHHRRNILISNSSLTRVLSPSTL